MLYPVVATAAVSPEYSRQQQGMGRNHDEDETTAPSHPVQWHRENQALQQEYAGYESVWRARSSAGSEISVGICQPLEAALMLDDHTALPGVLPPSSARPPSWGESTRASTPAHSELGDDSHIREVLVCSPGADSVDMSR